MVSPEVMRALRKNKTLRYGVPMLFRTPALEFCYLYFQQVFFYLELIISINAPPKLLIVGGSFGLREFSQIRYDAVKSKIDPDLEKKLKMNKISLESEYEKIKDSTFEDWKNIRGPRPWEDPDLLQEQNSKILKTKTT